MRPPRHESRLAKTRTCKRRQCSNQMVAVPGKKYCTERCKKAAGSARRGEGMRDSKHEAIGKTTSFTIGKLRQSADYHGHRFGIEADEMFALILEDLEDRIGEILDSV